MIQCTFEDNGHALLRHVTTNTLVLKYGKILLVKRSEKLLEGGKWGLIGGYLDRDETIKESVTREIFEETGYTVNNVELLTIRDNPDRPREDRQNISFVFFCEAVEKKGEPDWESTDQEWFAFDALPKKEDFAFDNYEDIQLYLECKKGVRVNLL